MADNLEYAPNGYLFMRVSTPQVFEEYLIPTTGRFTVVDRENYERLQHLAEVHHTTINGSTYRCG